MTDKAISPLRRRLIEDMAIRRLSPKTQLHYIRHIPCRTIYPVRRSTSGGTQMGTLGAKQTE